MIIPFAAKTFLIFVKNYRSNLCSISDKLKIISNFIFDLFILFMLEKIVTFSLHTFYKIHYQDQQST